MLLRGLSVNINKVVKTCKLIFFGVSWFFIGLLPVVFLPIHKFTFYLTIPLIGVTFVIAYLLVESKISKLLLFIFLIVWTVTSILTLKFTAQTNWITQDEAISQRAFQFFSSNESYFLDKKAVFVDSQEDSALPWSPTQVVKIALSTNNFFDVFYPKIANNINYLGKGDVVIKSRQFLGY